MERLGAAWVAARVGGTRNSHPKRIAEHQKLLIQQQDAAVVCCVSGKMVTVDTVLNLSGVVQMVDSDISKHRIEII